MLDIQEIKKIIPHRYPFILIDKVFELNPGKSAVACKNVTINEYFFQGHFEQEPVMPGVLIVEALAQTGAVAILSLDEYKGKIVYFAGINNFKFRNKVLPGDSLILEIEIINRKGKIGVGKGTAKVNDKIVAMGELTFAVS